jgi:hypothetical protein
VRIANLPRPLTRREVLADHLYLHLQIVARLLPVPAAIIGHAVSGVPGAVTGFPLGAIVGWWAWRSLGKRGPEPAGFFVRMRERAGGSRRGALEALIEAIRGHGFTRRQCAEMVDAHERAAAALRRCTNRADRDRILGELDRRVKELSYGRSP